MNNEDLLKLTEMFCHCWSRECELCKTFGDMYVVFGIDRQPRGKLICLNCLCQVFLTSTGCSFLFSESFVCYICSDRNEACFSIIRYRDESDNLIERKLCWECFKKITVSDWDLVCVMLALK